MKGIIGKKLGMTQIFGEDGVVIPVTIIEVGPCYVTQKKELETDKYEAIQIGFEEVPERRLNNPKVGHLKKAGVPPVRHLREVRGVDLDEYEVGQEIGASLFTVGELVDVSGVSKGKGFAGVVKRHNFAGGPKTHGQSDRWRAPGSAGAGSTPGRIFKGTRMPGRMGNHQVTVQNLLVALVDEEKNLLGVRGAVPGANNSIVFIKTAVKAK